MGQRLIPEEPMSIVFNLGMQVFIAAIQRRRMREYRLLLLSLCSGGKLPTQLCYLDISTHRECIKTDYWIRRSESVRRVDILIHGYNKNNPSDGSAYHSLWRWKGQPGCASVRIVLSLTRWWWIWWSSHIVLSSTR